MRTPKTFYAAAAALAADVQRRSTPTTATSPSSPRACCRSAPSDVDPRPADQRRRQLRVEGLPRRRRAPARRSTRRRAARQLEQQARPRLRRRRRRVELRLGPARRPAQPQASPPSAEARPRVGDVGDERRRDAGPARGRHGARCSRACCTARRRRPRARADARAAAPVARRGREPPRPQPRRQDRRARRRRSWTRSWTEARRRGHEPVLGHERSRSSRRSSALRPARRRAVPAAGTATWTRTCARCSATSPEPFAARYCGAGNVAACRDSLWAASTRPARSSTAAQGGRPGAVARRRERGAHQVRARACCRRRCATRTARRGIQQVISFKGHRAAP